MDTLGVLTEDLGISPKYIKISTTSKHRAIIVVHETWIRTLLKTEEVPDFIHHESLTGDEVRAWLHQDEDLGPLWMKLYVKVIFKQRKRVIPLPRARNVFSKTEPELSFAQLLHYVSHSNHKNLWKEAFKKYMCDAVSSEEKGGPQINLVKFDVAMRDIITRTYGCPIFCVDTGTKTKAYQVPSNVLPALCALELQNCFVIIYHPYIPHTVHDCVTFSPAVLGNSHAKPLFIIYQLLQAMRTLHDRGLVLGDVTLSDLFITENLWIQIVPQLENNIHDKPKTEKKQSDESLKRRDHLKYSEDLSDSPDHAQECNVNVTEGMDLQQLCKMWVYGQLSNFDYLTALNNLAGRRFGDPTCHHVMPWVTDFSSRTGSNWRDLSKSKYRLNKGDRQLDLTFDNAAGSSQVPHHVSDVLSEITYYVYLSRRTPRSILCKYVRTNWVPAEYPSSIQRLQEWTPDECIPEFFTDPSVFESIHDDLPDLEVPSWALSTQDLIEKHREALESLHVSERLHHWIDLTFGYKLSGSAAVKSKNVCLHLVDSHTTLTNTGVVQLFNQPHPQRHLPSPFWGKSPPKLHLPTRDKKKACERVSEDEGQSSGFEEEELPVSRSSRFSPRSKASVDESAGITLPKEYNPAGALHAVEQLHSFVGKTFHTSPLFKDFHQETSTNVSYKQVVAGSRIKEMQVLGCLVVELFLASKFRALGNNSCCCFSERLDACLTVVSQCGESLPRCVRQAVALLLQSHIRYPTVTGQGLPPPSAHQLLQPILSTTVFPFPFHFARTYSLLKTLHEFSEQSDLLRLVNEEEKEIEEKTILIGECKVTTLANELAVLASPESLDLLLPYVRELLKDPATSVLAAWRLFDPVARALGPQKANVSLLEPIVKLYDYSSSDESGVKHVKLYHRSFLLQVIVRLGLKVFLDNFAAPLVEAVGGYRDFLQSEQCQHHHRSEFRSKTSHLISCDLDEGSLEVDGVLSPLDEDSSVDSDHSKNVAEDYQKNDDEPSDVEAEPEVFVFENEENGRVSPTVEGEAPLYHLMDHLELNLPQPPDNSSLELQDDDETISILQDDADVIGSPKSPGHVVVERCGTGDVEEFKSTETDSSFFRSQGSRKFTSHCKVSDMSADSVVWLSHRLGPVLTARHLSRNLLRMLTLCYLGQENLCTSPSQGDEDTFQISVTKTSIVGDQNAVKVLECLASIAALYGEQFIVLQYLPHMGELIALCKRKLTVNLEGGLVGCLALLRYIVPYLCDATLMDQLQDVILKTILHPAIRLLSTARFTFPSGYAARAAVTTKFIDAVYVVALRIGCEMTRRHLTVPSLQRFFLTFGNNHGRKESPLRSLEECNYLEGRHEGTASEGSAKGLPVQVSHVRVRESDSADSFSPPTLMSSDRDSTSNKAIEELKQVFTAQLAHMTYLPFFRFLGESVMDSCLKNHDFVRNLCHEYEEEVQSSSSSDMLYLSDYLSPGGQSHPDNITGSGSFGSNVAVVGNRIDLQRADVSSLQQTPSGEDVMALISQKMENTNRHLHGNWLLYWEHEIGRSEKDTLFNFKQIKLQTFSAHTNSVRAVLALDNENSFISGSRDKTVKLWSLRSQGDGSAVSQCQWTYTGHRKTVLAITFLESLRLAASCDSVVHLWDPFMGCVVSQLDSVRNPPVTVLRAMPPPSTSLMAATTDATLRLLDARSCSFVSELKVSLSPAGLIRCIALAPSGNWVAVGQSSGFLTVLDIRTGMVLASWKGHEGEVLQLVAASDNTLVSSSLDQSVSAWSALDGKLNFNIKGPTEPVHCMSAYGTELITATTANRIGVHTAVDPQASFSSTRLRSDTFKGVLTAMAVLPLNRLLLLGGDTGNISLLC